MLFIMIRYLAMTIISLMVENRFEDPDFIPDSAKLAFFDYKQIKKTMLERAAIPESLNFSKMFISRKDTLRDDRRDLAKL